MKKQYRRISQFMLIGLCAVAGISAHVQAQERPQELTPETSRKIITQPRENMNVDVWFDKQCGSPYKQGEKILINFKANSDGYLTVYDIDTRGQVSVIFPNKQQPNNYVRGGQTYTVPDRTYSYDLIVEGPEGIEYVDAVVSNDPYYSWDYRQGEPRWVREWGLSGRNYSGASGSGYKSSAEYQNRPQDFSQEGEQSLARNFGISRELREEIRSKIVVQPRDNSGTSGGGQAPSNYGTATCYFYVTSASPQPVVNPYPSRQDYIQQQQQQFQQIPGIGVRREGERLIVTMPSTILFDTDSYALRYEARRDLDQVANILMNFPDTNITVAGHTDSVGSDSYNQRLSENRAQSVANYLVSRGVPPYRIGSVGYGESMPIASNSTDSGRQRNRRVELDIRMNQQYGN
ncbi:outer membrane protein [Candidatus Moduliflexus flocculans]|uniref:Outer membrane protein n=1 Tax=Candidatus Moduliflexus flocculans TaxID=1499966 RepID=A0A0S6W4Q8_9BACT|nr:outer membrane protein [Candidatus Moduliflexus flocculans]